MDNLTIEQATKAILTAIGETPSREGLQETPARVAKMLSEVFAHTGETTFTDFKLFHVDTDPRMVLIDRIPFYSMCEHHLLPFFGEVNVAYVPKNGQVIGLSKIPRLVDFVAQRPNMQERLTTDIAAQLTSILDPAGVAVTVNARHMCMEMRGIQKSNLYTHTSQLTGVFATDTALRQEFLQVAGGRLE